jgi:hypothetical protein
LEEHFKKSIVILGLRSHEGECPYLPWESVQKNAWSTQLWQDGAKLVDASGPMLPFGPAIYNSLEVGISAHASGEHASTLFVDDMEIESKKP